MSAQQSEPSVTTIKREPLLSVAMPLRPLSAVQAYRIRFEAGQKGGLHLHPCPVTGYIVEGTAILQEEGKEPRLLEAGAAFFEPPMARILRFDNASDTEPMTFIAFYLLNGDQALIEMLPG